MGEHKFGSYHLKWATWQGLLEVNSENFHANRKFTSDRNPSSLEHRGATIHKECQKFQGLYDEVEHLHPSGVPRILLGAASLLVQAAASLILLGAASSISVTRSSKMLLKAAAASLVSVARSSKCICRWKEGVSFPSLLAED
ncbi:cytokinin inducible protein-like [Striga asiatica]|uniref:Cytokinin inducible protein-like n=1 Tax=Striga asiatica TaxID=4170 RepID=A0A5A7QX42_STRAF|nr:cytokinin inducible protein-like [Striga asiatica]